MSYTLTTLPYLTYFDSNNNALTGGYVQSYDNSTGDPAPFYEDPEGTSEYENPLYFLNSGQLPQLYTDPTIETYSIQVYDSNDALINSFTLSPTSTTSTTSSTTGFNNLILNGQFQFYEDQSTSPAPSTEILIANDAFYFEKDGTGGEDSISFELFSLDTTEPESTPQNYFNYTCTSAATSETYKDIIYKIQNVRSLQDTEVTFSISACTLDSQDVSISLYVQQYFGTGGTPSNTETTLIAGYTLTTTFTTYSSVFTIPSLEGEAIGTNNDDSLNIILRMPLNQISNIGITNFYFQEGNNMDITYPFQTYAQTKSSIQSSDLPTPTSLDNQKVVTYSTTGYNGDGNYVLQNPVPIGTILDYLGTSNPGNGWYLANGQSVPISGYFSDFYNLIGYNFTLSSGFSIVSLTTNVCVITCDEIGTMASPVEIYFYESGNIAFSAINNGSTTTRGYFTITFGAGTTFRGGNTAQSSTNMNSAMVLNTPDGNTHLIIFILDNYPPTVNTINLVTLYNTVTYVKINSTDTSTQIAFKFANTLSLSSPHGLATSDNLFSALVITNGVQIYNSLPGVPLNQPTIGTTPFTLEITTVGTTGVYQDYTYTVTSAADMEYGQYLTCSTINYDLIFWFIIDGDGTQPDISADFYIPVSLSSTDTDSEVSQTLQTSMQTALMNIPDLRAMFTRGLNFSETTLSTYSYYHDPGNRTTQANMVSSTMPGSLQINAYDKDVYATTNNTIMYDGDNTVNDPTGSYIDTRPNNFAVNKIIKIY